MNARDRGRHPLRREGREGTDRVVAVTTATEEYLPCEYPGRTVTALIRIESVSKVFGRGDETIDALAAIDLDIGENEFVTIVGRSGCGKSTLLRIVAGLVPTSTGRVSISGSAVIRPRRDVSMVFQRPALLPWRNVIDNVLLPVEILGLDKREHRAAAHELLELVGLGGFERRRPHELSGGMQQRVALCRSLIYDPAVLLMDEPFAALDALTREELSLELQRIWTERRKTILFVTHSVQEAILLADRVVVMTPRPGRIAQMVDVDLPRPRSLGLSEQTETLNRVIAEVHDLLFLPDSAFEQAGERV
jgi:NitT/TauT family transport system ATP-binding protein